MRYQVIIFDSNHCKLCEKDILNYYGERDVEELASILVLYSVIMLTMDLDLNRGLQ